MRFAISLAGGMLVAAACASPPPAADSLQDTSVVAAPASADVSDGSGLFNRTWSLTRLGTQQDPLGAGERPVTLRIETEPNAIAGGFAGCNRYTGPYTVRGDSISFGPSVSTKMACAAGMELEQSYLSTLPTVERYVVQDSALVLLGRGGPLAEYRARADSI